MQNSEDKKGCPNFGHGTEQKGMSVDILSPTFPLEKKERQLMIYLSNLKGHRFNLRHYALKIADLPRSTVYGILERLISKGLISKPYDGNHVLTDKGKNVLDVVEPQDNGVENLRRECREGAVNLSTHYLKYKISINEKSNFSESRIKELNSLEWYPLDLPNLRQYYVYFSDATLIIGPKTITISIHDIITQDTDTAQFQAFSLAMNYIKRLRSIGLKGDSIRLDAAHYARVESILANALSKIDNRYFLDLEDGSKFWIDCSNDKLEDETNNVVVRERVDETMKYIMTHDVNLGELPQIKEVLGMITRIQLTQIGSQYPTQIKGKIERPDYFG